MIPVNTPLKPDFCFKVYFQPIGSVSVLGIVYQNQFSVSTLIWR